MGSEQSSPLGPPPRSSVSGEERGGREAGGTLSASSSASSPLHRSSTTASTTTLQQFRDGGISPRQGSVCSDTDVPFVSYTVNKPIGGDSPKRKPPPARSATSRFSPRLGSRKTTDSSSTRLARSAHNTLVTVNHLRLAEELRSDEELVRLAEIPTFFPVMQQQQQEAGRGPAQADILGRLDPTPLNSLLQRYEEFLRNAASRTAADQGRLSRRMRDVEAETAGLAAALQERQRRYERACEKLAGVRDISRTLAKCHMLLNENIDMMEALNSSLPPDLRLEPFVWTTG